MAFLLTLFFSRVFTHPFIPSHDISFIVQKTKQNYGDCDLPIVFQQEKCNHTRRRPGVSCRTPRTLFFYTPLIKLVFLRWRKSFSVISLTFVRSYFINNVRLRPGTFHTSVDNSMINISKIITQHYQIINPVKINVIVCLRLCNHLFESSLNRELDLYQVPS